MKARRPTRTHKGLPLLTRARCLEGVRRSAVTEEVIDESGLLPQSGWAQGAGGTAKAIVDLGNTVFRKLYRAS